MKDQFSFDSAGRDKYYWQQVERLRQTAGYSTEDMLRQFPAYAMRRDLPRFLAHYELFKLVVDLPGCVVDLGVYRGASFFTFSSLMESFCPFDRSRKVFGFDHFAGLTQFSDKDGRKDGTVAKVEGGYKATLAEIEMLVEIHNLDNMIPGTKRCILVNGDIKDTLPQFLEQNPGLKIALLHFDMDLYEPTKIAMEALYPYVLKGVVVCFDEYAPVPWGGETTAMDEYFRQDGRGAGDQEIRFHANASRLLHKVKAVQEQFTFEAGAEAGRLHRAFEDFGVVVIKQLMSKDELREQRAAVNRLLAIGLESLGHSAASDDIDENLDALVGIDRPRAMDIIRAVKDLPFFYSVLANPHLHNLSKACLHCEKLLSAHDIAQFRIDPPNDDVRKFDWHQDFQYNVMSMNSVTVWYPLKSVSEEMGPLGVAPGSHRVIVPVDMDFGSHQPGVGTMHSVLRLKVDERAAERSALTLCPVEEGDVVLFHSLLLHRSSANRSTRSRWTVNPRFGDASDGAFAGRGWLAVRDKTQGVFAQYYPDYVTKKPVG